MLGRKKGRKTHVQSIGTADHRDLGGPSRGQCKKEELDRNSGNEYSFSENHDSQY